jgi:hypothetical protein
MFSPLVMAVFIILTTLISWAGFCVMGPEILLACWEKPGRLLPLLCCTFWLGCLSPIKEDLYMFSYFLYLLTLSL